jgi:hypothetical protein
MYRHTQTARLIIVLFAAIGLIPAAALIGVIPSKDARGINLAVLALLLLAGWLLSSLTITVDRERLAWRFGPGLIRKSVPVGEIAQAERARASWIWGWGIHWTPRGWLYNVSGFDAVQIRLADGKQFLLGTDDPDGLLAALDAACRAAPVG